MLAERNHWFAAASRQSPTNIIRQDADPDAPAGGHKRALRRDRVRPTMLASWIAQEYLFGTRWAFSPGLQNRQTSISNRYIRKN